MTEMHVPATLVTQVFTEEEVRTFGRAMFWSGMLIGAGLVGIAAARYIEDQERRRALLSENPREAPRAQTDVERVLDAMRKAEVLSLLEEVAPSVASSREFAEWFKAPEKLHVRWRVR